MGNTGTKTGYAVGVGYFQSEHKNGNDDGGNAVGKRLETAWIKTLSAHSDSKVARRGELYGDAEQRLRFTFQLVWMLAERERPTVIQSWLTGLNP